ncbi:hypothetical protein [Rubinisphaera margarita]|uniref:hypothetical protein n=1 Tax=Rubinisphaera margarita TaxID=2909586 RepID=UPI001EE8F257|nr:hypothetical protein [Rubinisphaera margarita]MCG6157376.1 hypothetical protein [Rubinisphaera margarita]
MMIPLRSRRSFLSTLTLSALSVGLSGCGTFLYPERRGQQGGRIDWKVVALDGIGLLLFFIPGVIAFAVDIYSGAIYLPPDEYSGTQQPEMHEGFVSIPLPAERRDTQSIEAVIAENTGKQIQLEDENCHRTRLPALAQFTTLTERLKEQCGLG